MNRREIEQLIKDNLDVLTRQQVKTIRGQLNARDFTGAEKGLKKILNRVSNTKKEGEINWQKKIMD